MLIYFYLIYISIIIVIYLYTVLLFHYYISIIWFIFNNLLQDIWHITWTLGLNWKKKKKMSLTPPLITPTNPNLTPLYHHHFAFESPFSCFWKSFLIYHNFLSLPFFMLSCDCKNVKDMELLKVIQCNKIIKNHLLISLSLSLSFYVVQAVLCVFFYFYLIVLLSRIKNQYGCSLWKSQPKLGLKAP